MLRSLMGFASLAVVAGLAWFIVRVLPAIQEFVTHLFN